MTICPAKRFDLSSIMQIERASFIPNIQESENIFKAWIPKMESVFKENLENRFKELLGENYDEQRVLTEIAAMLVKYTINEEVVRLQSHIDALKAEIQSNPCPGRKIDFICQEMNREINTIGSKTQFLEVGQAVIEAKDALEKAAKILRDHLNPFLGSDVARPAAPADPDVMRQYQQFIKPVEVLDLSVRAMNCLNNANIKLLGELCTKSESRMLKFRNFGKKSLEEIKEKACYHESLSRHDVQERSR